jgi:stearoyl-CoA desaturase (delta-9 desaturase)
MSPFAYGVMHRLHHMHTDEEEDPHSPAFHPGFWQTMWQTRNSYHAIYTGNKVVEEKLKKDLPLWNNFEKIAHNWLTRVVWIIIYVSVYILLATAWWQYMLLPFTVIMCTLQGTMINWWAHKYGYVNYQLADTSKNILPVDFLFIGDAYHNNHHKFPGRAKNAHRWFEIDPIYHVTCLLNKLHIVTWKNQPSD